MQDLLSIISPCSKTLYKHQAFCPCLSSRTWEYFLAPLPRYSCQLHTVLCWEQTQLPTAPLSPMQWKKPQLVAQEVTAKHPWCSPDLDGEYLPGANLPHILQTTLTAEAHREKAFINISFIVQKRKRLKVDHSLPLQSSFFVVLGLFSPEDLGK